MKMLVLPFVTVCVLFCSITGYAQNPFFSDYDTPFGVPPFEKIQEEHYMPAFKEGIKQGEAEIQAIVDNPEAPTFENTIEALERSGVLLSKVQLVFYNLLGAHTNDTLQEIAQEASPMFSKYRDDILLNEDLFQRVKAVYVQKDRLNLTKEQKKLLDKYYKDFVRGGANLDEEKKAQLREINEELSLLSLQFGDNVLKEDNDFYIVLEREEDLVGLPENVISAAAEAATERGHEGQWVITLHKPSWIPFLQYSGRRDLREKIYKGYINRGDNDNEYDNKEIASRMAALRVKRIKLLGYKTHAHYILEEYMAKEPENVYKLLDQLWKPALAKAKQEAAEFQQMIYDEGDDFKLESWDWWYYAEKVKKAKYDLDEEMTRPYFKLENVIDGVVTLSNKLFGITLTELQDMPKYHEDVKVFEVKNQDGFHVGILYTDYFPRASKRGGAWMSNYREQMKIGGTDIRPIICNVGNFSKPTADNPSLLSLDEVTTLFHEFGHALHGMLSECTYERLSGTNVPRDFVKLPSQIMENWAFEPEMLKIYARHYKTGEPMPEELIEKIDKAGKFNQGFKTVEYLAASFLDMDWHTLTEPEELDPIEFENETFKRIGLIPEIISRYRSPYFRHIFSGGYSSGYYSYIWAEVLDADAFQAFVEKGLFDRETGMAFRKHILSKGGTEDPMELYVRFRGTEPKIEPLLEKRGLN
ncbi:MAG: M3 family metallopeptidase [Gemmatimonadota bacterium]|nr:MAG: M3 family metallopeptidase [Gemmatimonadota bacterium]